LPEGSSPKDLSKNIPKSTGHKKDRIGQRVSLQYLRENESSNSLKIRGQRQMKLIQIEIGYLPRLKEDSRGSGLEDKDRQKVLIRKIKDTKEISSHL